MFDMKLFKLPTFSGGSVAAFGLSASIFSMLLYLVLYVQDILGYSPLATGARLMVISGGIGIFGALLGGWLATKLFHVVTLHGFFNLSTWLTAIAGAAILLLAYHLITSRSAGPSRSRSNGRSRSRRWAHR